MKNHFILTSVEMSHLSETEIITSDLSDPRLLMTERGIILQWYGFIREVEQRAQDIFMSMV